ncbi:MAG: hypothetical protein KDJ36_01575 [Hyphomicrobiaceae bacterium]|nr:hypothetical protein [Hyphomicrobiaceae bacterium]
MNMIDGPGALSSAVLARIRPVGEAPDSTRSHVIKAGWMVAAAAIVVAGASIAFAVKASNAPFSSASVVAFLMGQKAEPNVGQGQAQFKLTGQLKRRSSFSSEAAFKDSPSFRTLLLAGRALPLAIHCKDDSALGAIKTVLGFISERDPFYAEMMARGFMQRQPERFKFTPADCRKTLPTMLSDLRNRV